MTDSKTQALRLAYWSAAACGAATFHNVDMGPAPRLEDDFLTLAS